MKYKLFLDYDNLPFRFPSSDRPIIRFKRRFGEVVLDEDRDYYPDPESLMTHNVWKFTLNVAITENSTYFLERASVYDTF
jgi:hypothetical protein